MAQETKADREARERAEADAAEAAELVARLTAIPPDRTPSSTFVRLVHKDLPGQVAEVAVSALPMYYPSGWALLREDAAPPLPQTEHPAPQPATPVADVARADAGAHADAFRAARPRPPDELEAGPPPGSDAWAEQQGPAAAEEPAAEPAPPDEGAGQ